MNLDIETVDPIKYSGWDNLLLTSPQYSFFHSSAWAKVLSESYGYRPYYFAQVDNNTLSLLVAIMEVGGRILGKRGVSLPFSDSCEIIVKKDLKVYELFTHLVSFGKKKKWCSLELRNGTTLLPTMLPSESYLGHTLYLSNNVDTVFSKFRDSTKGNIRKATKSNVVVKLYTSSEGLEQYYRLHCITRKKHGLPPQPLSFFRKIFQYVISNNFGFTMIATYGARTVAGGVYFHIGKKAIFKYAASNDAYHHLRINNLVMWKAIKWYAQHGFDSICLGRTGMDNKGLNQYKNGWGTVKKRIEYTKYDLKREVSIISKQKLKGYHNKIFQNIPTVLARGCGSLLYKHFG